MNKKYLSVFAVSALLMGTAGTFTSCKDYDDDINNLQEQIDANKVTLDDLKKKIEAGFLVTKCEKNADGALITFSNGETCQLYNGAKGEDGKDGVDGKDADVWTIGSDGYWYKNSKKTEYKAIGTDGVDGEDGKDGVDGLPGADGEDGKDGVDGEDGKDGQNGYYYVPNKDTECFDIYQLDENGEPVFIKKTDISYVAKNGLTVVHNGNKLIVKGAVDADGNVISEPVEISLGKALGSVAFVPEVMDGETMHYTTTQPFLFIKEYLDENKADGSGKFVKQYGLDKSNEVEMIYRLNPTNAYTEGAMLSFINRDLLITRAVAGDKADLLNVLPTSKIVEGTAVVNATVNATKLAKDSKVNLAALQMVVGQDVVTSDYISVIAKQIGFVLADKENTKEGKSAVTFYEREKALGKVEETDAFVKQFVKIEDAVSGVEEGYMFEFKYEKDGNPGEIDLNGKVALYNNTYHKYLENLGFSGMSYEFTLPEEYLAVANDKKTNQQWFVKEVSEGVIAVNEDNLTGGLISAIGRTPVVRVDAFLTNNKGEKKLLASSYIKLKITEQDPVQPEDQPANPIEIAKGEEFVYQNLTGEYTQVSLMDWMRINNEMYGKENLTSTTFWQNYDAATVTVTVVDKNGGKKVLVEDAAVAEGSNELCAGLSLDFNMNSANTETSKIQVNVNNLALTQNTYKNVGDKGAEYTVTITIPSKDKTAHGDFVLTQVVYVKDVCKGYNLNELYKVNENTIEVKGQLNGTWEMSSMVSEHFAKNAAKENIFTYWNAPVYTAEEGLTFEWKQGTTGVTPEEAFTTDQVVALSEAMTTAKETKVMTYSVPLANGEEACKFEYNIIFVNPFKGVAANAVKFYDGVGENTVGVQPQVKIVDNDADVIYSWNAVTEQFELSVKASDTYKVVEPTVTYAFDETNKDYIFLTQQMSDKSELTISEEGVVTWKNEGTTLQKDLNLTVIATVEFEKLSKVTINIPVTLAKKN